MGEEDLTIVNDRIVKRRLRTEQLTEKQVREVLAGMRCGELMDLHASIQILIL